MTPDPKKCVKCGANWFIKLGQRERVGYRCGGSADFKTESGKPEWNKKCLLLKGLEVQESDDN